MADSAQEKKSAIVFPTAATLNQAFKLGIKFTKQIDPYFYLDSLKGRCFIVNDGDENILYKNDEEHTSPVLKVYKSDESYIIITNNTIYIIHKDTPFRKSSDLAGGADESAPAPEASA